MVLTKLYGVHQSDTYANVSISNELREQFARTLREDEARAEESMSGPAITLPKPGEEKT